MGIHNGKVGDIAEQLEAPRPRRRRSAPQTPGGCRRRYRPSPACRPAATPAPSRRPSLEAERRPLDRVGLESREPHVESHPDLLAPRGPRSRRAPVVAATDRRTPSKWTSCGRGHRSSDRESSHGSSCTVNRSAGHRSAAQAKKSTPSSSSTVRCSTPVTIHGRSGSCSVTVNENERTNVCSHEGAVPQSLLVSPLRQSCLGACVWLAQPLPALHPVGSDLDRA